MRRFTLFVEEALVLGQDDTIGCDYGYGGDVQSQWEDGVLIVNPEHLTIIAPRPILGMLAGLPVRVDVHCEFHMPCNTLSIFLSFSQSPSAACPKKPHPTGHAHGPHSS